MLCYMPRSRREGENGAPRPRSVGPTGRAKGDRQRGELSTTLRGRGQRLTVVRGIKHPHVRGADPFCDAAPPRRNARPVSGQCGAHLPLGASSRIPEHVKGCRGENHETTRCCCTWALSLSSRRFAFQS
jgi:hypothetical protein